jgi:hypothetical protein
MTFQELFGEPVSIYSRAQAIADGELVDVSATAREAGIRFPVAITRAAWADYVTFLPEDGADQDEAGRLWDVLWMLRCAISLSAGGPELTFRLHVAKADRGNWKANEAPPERGSGLRRCRHRLVTLRALCGPGDTPEPCITILRPEED